MTDLSKILTHPEKDFIISELVSGKTAKNVNQYLALKYTKPEQKHLIISSNILKEFVDKHINLYEQLEKDLQAQHEGKLNTKIPESLLKNKTYQERLVELAGKEIDVVKSLEKIVFMLEQRLEQLFDKTQIDPNDTKDDYTLIKIHDSLMIALEKYDKIKNNKPDHVIQHNVTIQQMESHSMIFQEAIRETLAEFDAETSSRFMDLLGTKLSQLKPAPIQEHKFTDVDMRLTDVKQLSESIEAKFEDNE